MEYTSLVRCENYQADTVHRAFEQALSLHDVFSFVRPGMKIVVKPNLLMKKDPKDACTTHPTILSEVVKRLIDLGAQVVVGDSPGGLFTPSRLRSIYQICGLTSLQDLGAKLNEDVTEQQVFNSQGEVLKTVDLCSFILQADAIVNVAKLKTHSLMGYSGAVKNLFGAIPGITKAEYHYRMPSSEHFAKMLVDLALYLKPSVSIIDAVVGMEGDGPSQGTPKQIGALIVSENPFHADRIATQLVGADKKHLPTEIEAKARGLQEDIQLLGESVESMKIEDYHTIDGIWPTQTQTKSKKKGIFLLAQRFDRVILRIMQPIPKVIKKKCIGCQDCKNACPAHCIEMQDKKPVIDRSRCIRCFCCQEMCPVSAMVIHRSWLVRQLTGKKTKKQTPMN